MSARTVAWTVGWTPRTLRPDARPRPDATTTGRDHDRTRPRTRRPDARPGRYSRTASPARTVRRTADTTCQYGVSRSLSVAEMPTDRGAAASARRSVLVAEPPRREDGACQRSARNSPHCWPSVSFRSHQRLVSMMEAAPVPIRVAGNCSPFAGGCGRGRRRSNRPLIRVVAWSEVRAWYASGACTGYRRGARAAVGWGDWCLYRRDMGLKSNPGLLPHRTCRRRSGLRPGMTSWTLCRQFP